MTKLIVGKVMWIGRATVFAVGLAVTLALMLGVATTALAAVPGDPFRLGEVNLVRATTTLAASVGGPTLVVENSESNRAATALGLRMENPNLAPIRTNATGKVTNLNADALDGKDSTQFLATDGKAGDADRLDGKDSDAFLQESDDRNDFLPNNIYVVTSAALGTAGNGSSTGQLAMCDVHDRVLSGGGGSDSSLDVAYYSGHELAASGGYVKEGWRVRVRDNHFPSEISAEALCADFPPLR